MAWKPLEGMNDYLKATKLCDCDDMSLKKKANEIVDGVDNPGEGALRIFHFVRDEIVFGMDYPDVRASHTLKKGAGFCIPKANLQMALLRAVGIPSRCHFVHLPKETNKRIVPGFMYDRMPAAIAHPWCECYLSGQWITCEALLDEAYYAACLKAAVFTKGEVPTIDWDGKTNLIVVKPWILKDIGTFLSWDDAMLEARRSGAAIPPTNRLLVGWFMLYLIDRRINDIRKS